MGLGYRQSDPEYSLQRQPYDNHYHKLSGRSGARFQRQLGFRSCAAGSTRRNLGRPHRRAYALAAARNVPDHKDGRRRLPADPPERELPLTGSVRPTIRDQYSLKFTSTFTCTATACPSFVPATNCHLRTASIAFSSSPIPSERATRIFLAFPDGSTISESTTVP